MHTTIMGGTSRPKTKTFFHRHADLPAQAQDTWPGLLTRENLRHLVASMVD